MLGALHNLPLRSTESTELSAVLLAASFVLGEPTTSHAPIYHNTK